MSAPVGVPADILRIVDTAIDVCNDRDRPAMAEDLEAVRLYVEQASAALAQQPAPVAPVEVDDLAASLLDARERMISALGPKFGEAFDGDFDVMRDAADTLSHLKRLSDAARGLLARRLAQQPAAVVGDWRKNAAEWLEAKAVEQEAANQKWPSHAACYKEWRDRPGILRHLAIQVLAAQQGGDT